MKRKKSTARLEHERWEKQTAQRIAEREAEIAEREAERVVAEANRAERVQNQLEKLRVEHEARKAHTSEITRQHPFDLPPVGWTAEEFLLEDDRPLEAVIEGLHYRGGNTLLVAEFKTGKTTMEVALAKSLADGEPFLGKFPVNMPYGRIAFLNYEMDARQFRTWLRRSGIKHPDRIVPLNLRGWQLPFWNEEEMNRLAEWLLQNKIGFIILDPAARAWRGLVENEGDNVQLAEFFGALDELKRLGDVSNLLISVHKPRAKEDRARGGGEIEAWPDSNWYLNRKENTRIFRAEGRDVDQPPVTLEFDEETMALSAGQLADTVQLTMDVLAVVGTLKSHGPVSSLTELITSVKGRSSDRVRAAAKEAVVQQLIIEEQNGQSKSFRVNPEPPEDTN